MECILIHGLGQTQESWEPVKRALPQEISAICPDFRELLSEVPTTYPNLYGEFCRYCEGLEQPLNLCGLSLGGVLALDYALNHPQQVRSVVLAAAQYRVPAALLRFQNILFRMMPQRSFSGIGMGKQEVIELMNSMMQLDFGEKLKSLSCPALILCGEKDRANRRASLELAQKLPLAQLQLVEGAGHELNVEAPQKMAEYLVKFYRQFGLNETSAR